MEAVGHGGEHAVTVTGNAYSPVHILTFAAPLHDSHAAGAVNRDVRGGDTATHAHRPYMGSWTVGRYGHDPTNHSLFDLLIPPAVCDLHNPLVVVSCVPGVDDPLVEKVVNVPVILPECDSRLIPGCLSERRLACIWGQKPWVERSLKPQVVRVVTHA
eukprot:3010398-Prymnesium_polylepis.1